jgi:hypothetical protein
MRKALPLLVLPLAIVLALGVREWAWKAKSAPAKKAPLRVVSVHPLPFTERDVDRYHEELGKTRTKESIRETLQAAHLVVAQTYSGFKLDQLSLAHPGDNDLADAQAPYMEEWLEPGKIGFYIHIFSQDAKLQYGDLPVAFPSPTKAEPDIWQRMPYVIP